MAPGGPEAFSVDAQIACFVLSKQVEGDAAEDGFVQGSMAGPFTAGAFAKTHVQNPVSAAADSRHPSADRWPSLAAEYSQRGSRRGESSERAENPIWQSSENARQDFLRNPGGSGH